MILYGDFSLKCFLHPFAHFHRETSRHKNYTIFKFFLSLNSKTFILKLFRYICPWWKCIFFCFIIRVFDIFPTFIQI